MVCMCNEMKLLVLLFPDREIIIIFVSMLYLYALHGQGTK